MSQLCHAFLHANQSGIQHACSSVDNNVGLEIWIREHLQKRNCIRVFCDEKHVKLLTGRSSDNTFDWCFQNDFASQFGEQMQKALLLSVCLSSRHGSLAVGMVGRIRCLLSKANQIQHPNGLIPRKTLERVKLCTARINGHWRKEKALFCVKFLFFFRFYFRISVFASLRGCVGFCVSFSLCLFVRR